MCDCVNFLEFENTAEAKQSTSGGHSSIPSTGLRQEILMEFEGLEMGTAVEYL